MATWLEKQRDKAKRDKLSREMTHTGRYDNEAIRKERWEQVKNAPGQYAQGMFTDFVGAPVDIANIALTPFGLGREKPVMGSRYLADLIGADESALPYQVAQYMPLDVGDVAMSAKLWGPALAAALGGTAIAAKASKGAKLSDLAQAMPKQRGIFAGVGAKTANHANLDLAKKLQAQGVPDADIWKQTGWTLDTPDKMPRFEIPDDAAAIRKDLGDPYNKGKPVGQLFGYLDSGGKIDDVLYHPELAKAYKDIPETLVGFKGGIDPTYGGSFNKDTNTINLQWNASPNVAQSTTLHELQHAIQQREGFARGGSPEQMARELPSNVDLSHAQIIATRIENGETPSQAAQWIKEKLGASPSIQAMDLGTSGTNKAFSQTSDPMEAYRRLAGEAEARLTQARMAMTPEQRLAQYPYQPDYFQKETGVPLRDLIVRKEGGAAMMIPPDVAKTLNTPLNLPADDVFARAVANTPNAQVTPEGLLMRVQRNQMPEQAMSESVRGGVFYLPEGSKQAKYYSTGKAGYGGGEKIAGETLVKNPLFVKGATGGKAPETAFDLMQGKGAYKSMRDDALRSLGGYGVSNSKKAELADKFLDKYAPELSGYGGYIVDNSGKGNQLAYALQEAAVASAARSKGHDAVLGYSKGKQGEFISELFDVRERSYPNAHGDYDVWEDFIK